MAPVTEERSAGVLVYRLPAGDGNDAGDKEPHFLLLDYGRYWDYAKGHVEKGEDDLAAARRELAEESGIDQVEIHDGFRFEMKYFFRHKSRGLIRKTVVYFLGRTEASGIKVSHEHVGGAFLPYAQALERVTYENAKKALRAAKAFLDRAAR